MARKANVPDTAVYASILKFEDQEDGTLLVHGKATDDTLDSDEQVCDPAWLERAMPEWFKFGNIREQHSSIAAGVATEYKNEGSEHFITAHVVDPSSIKKVKAGVLKGFSIGIRRPRVIKDNKAIGGRIVDGQIVEISLVDRPANPACTLTIAKTIDSELVQVEEYSQIEGEKMSEITATSIIELSKGFAADTVKFDQAAFDDARRALATLIQVEARELADGEDEVHSLACLLAAVHALMEWHEGEAASGEVAPIPELEEESEGMEMSVEPETVKEDLTMCDKCNKSETECKCAEGGYSAEEKSVKSDEAEEAVAEEVIEEIAEEEVAEEATPEVSEEEAVAEESEKAISKEEILNEVRELIVETVKSLLTNPEDGEEVVTKAAATQRIEMLETELAQVKALAAPSGPKRFAAASGTTQVDANKAKAAVYRAKADSASDRSLADGYRQLANDLEKSN